MAFFMAVEIRMAINSVGHKQTKLLSRPSVLWYLIDCQLVGNGSWVQTSYFSPRQLYSRLDDSLLGRWETNFKQQHCVRDPSNNFRQQKCNVDLAFLFFYFQFNSIFFSSSNKNGIKMSSGTVCVLLTFFALVYSTGTFTFGVLYKNFETRI